MRDKLIGWTSSYVHNMYQELMSRPKGGEGASDCVADVLGKVLDVHILIWKLLSSGGYRKPFKRARIPHMHALHGTYRTLKPPSIYGSDGLRTLPNTYYAQL